MERGHRRLAACAALLFSACNAPDAPRFAAPGAAPTASTDYDVRIAEPSGLGLLDVSENTTTGERAGIPCVTCHGGDAGHALANRQGHPVAVHRDLALQHGTLTCTSCHDPLDPGSLRLSNGDRVAMADYMRLCAQCHGPQFRDYEHGSHGGMQGHWDLAYGPRTRNGCLGCHGSHAPAYPRVRPAAPPHDRFLRPKHNPGSVVEQRWSEAAR